MKINFCGAINEVGRSCFIIQNNKGNEHLMLDCGIKLGNPIEYPIITDHWKEKLKHIVISHAHLDHAGYLPHLIKNINNINIYSTKPTRDLMHLLLSDYQRIHAMNNPEKVMFNSNDVSKVIQHIKQIEYNTKHDYNTKHNGHGMIPFTLYDAGHILGSAMVKVHGTDKSILYTGDVNLRESQLLSGCETKLSAHTMIMESTYGAHEDVLPSLKTASKELYEKVNKVLGRGGKILIPTFAVGRGQNILMVLENYMRSGAIPNVPIYIDGMINKANRIYRQNIIYGKEEIKMRILMSDDDPFKSKHFQVPKHRDRSDVLDNGPCIIVSTSGMLSGGPVLTYLKNLINDPKNMLIMVGYQVEGTLGRQLLDNEKTVTIDDIEHEVKIEVTSVPFSAHSDHNDLIKLVGHVKGLKQVIMVHGEKSKQDALEDDLNKKGINVIIPNLKKTIEI